MFRFRFYSAWLLRLFFGALLGGVCIIAMAQSPARPKSAAVAQPPIAADSRRLLQLGPGDSVAISVYGQPDMNSTVYVADDGTIPVPLAGAVQVANLSPSEAGARIEAALRSGNFLLDPHVTISVVQSRSQRVSVLGEVNTPGRYPIESNTPIYDVLAQAGGTKPTSADIAYILRPGKDGVMTRYEVNLKGLADNGSPLPTQTLQGGDQVVVPRADQFYILGEIQSPNMYRIEPGMTVEQAVAKAGGVTVRGSIRRIEIKRTDANGKSINVSGKLTDLVQANDVIRVKESIF